MSIVEIRFEDPIGTVIGRTLAPGQEVRVTGNITGMAGIPEMFTPVTLAINPIEPSGAFSPYHEGSKTNAAGNYWYDITLPNADCTAMVTVTVHSTWGDYYSEVVIGIGQQAPPPPPPGGDWWGTLWNFIPIAAIVVIGLSGYYLTKGVKKKTIGSGRVGKTEEL